MIGRPDSRGDGDGWLECAQGHRHWGLFGAAGLLLRRPADGGDEILLQHRATWSHHGGTWGLLGGARHSDETAVTAALREAGEEGGLSADGLRVHGRYDDEHGGWSYATVLASGPAHTTASPTGGESIDVEWVPVAEVEDKDLHPGFAATWPALRPALAVPSVVVDAANVMGSRPDGWWKDRLGAARRLVGSVAALAADGLPAAALPSDAHAALSRLWPAYVVVVEGVARPAADGAGDLTEVSVVAAEGSGDDAVVAEARAAGLRGPVVVVTADRELRARVAAAGAVHVGPRWLLDRLPG